jgi:hypothetical protein
MSTIGYMLNELSKNKYNIYIIISWFWDTAGLEKYNMKHINEEIYKIIKKCDIFIFHKHIKDYGVNASCLPEYVNSKAKKIQIPNMRLDYHTLNKKEFEHSMEMLEYSIQKSDFPDFSFIFKNISNIQFFNTPEHPTHYMLFLIAKSIICKIDNSQYINISIDDYKDTKNKEIFKKLKKYVLLPGRVIITKEISKITDISVNAEYFD